MKRNWRNNIPFIVLLLALSLFSMACHQSKQPSGEVYTCPMHPEIVSDKPGKCPICHMDLTKKETKSGGASDLVSDVVKPVNESVISSINTIHPMGDGGKGESLISGYITYDTRNFNEVSARFSGRIDRLYVRSQFEKLSKGQKLFDIYSPEIMNAEQDYLFILKQPNPDQNLLHQSKTKLLLLGLSESQLQHLAASGKVSSTVSVFSHYSGYLVEDKTMPQDSKNPSMGPGPSLNPQDNALSVKEGMYVEKGQSIFRIVNNDKVWAVLKVLPSAAHLVKPGQSVEIIPQKQPDHKLSAKVDFVSPFYESGNSVSAMALRVYLPNHDGYFKIGDQVTARLQGDIQGELFLPQSAVVDLGTRKVVFLKKGNAFVAHEVTTGASLADKIAVLSGLKADDEVAADARFLVDSESFIETDNDESIKK